jgi:NitT/TauT family transport system permease protein
MRSEEVLSTEVVDEVLPVSRWDPRDRPELITVPAFFLLVVGLWEGIVKLMSIPAFILPPPSLIAVELVALFQSPTFYRDLSVTLIETALGYVLGVAIAFLLGVIISQFELVEKTLYPYVVAVQTVPKIAIAPLLVIWFGFGLTSKVVVAALVAFFPMLVNVIEGLQSTGREEIELMQSLSASRWKIFWFVRLPNALPFIFAGLDVGIVLSILGAVVAEFVGSQAGLGNAILQLNFNMNIPAVFAVLVVLSAIGVAAHLLVRTIQKRVVFWARAETVIGA